MVDDWRFTQDERSNTVSSGGWRHVTVQLDPTQLDVVCEQGDRDSHVVMRTSCAIPIEVLVRLLEHAGYQVVAAPLDPTTVQVPT